MGKYWYIIYTSILSENIMNYLNNRQIF
jgi:hypothetical protein